MGVPCVCASYASSQGVSSFYQTFHTVCPDIARCEFGCRFVLERTILRSHICAVMCYLRNFDIIRLQMIRHKASELTHSQLLVENLLELMFVVLNVFGLVFGEFTASIFIVKFKVCVQN